MSKDIIKMWKDYRLENVRDEGGEFVMSTMFTDGKTRIHFSEGDTAFINQKYFSGEIQHISLDTLELMELAMRGLTPDILRALADEKEKVFNNA